MRLIKCSVQLNKTIGKGDITHLTLILEKYMSIKIFKLLFFPGYLTLTVLLLSSCSHSYVKKWGNGEVVTCCPTQKIFCSEDKLHELAAEKCGGIARAISGESVESGAVATYNSFGGGSGFINARATQDMCLTFKCN